MPHKSENNLNGVALRSYSRIKCKKGIEFALKGPQKIVFFTILFIFLTN
jgi:hypothetical protein